jgi:hypothetical protein
VFTGGYPRLTADGNIDHGWPICSATGLSQFLRFERKGFFT